MDIVLWILRRFYMSKGKSETLVDVNDYNPNKLLELDPVVEAS